MKEKTRKSYDTEMNMEFRQKRIELVYEARKYSPEPHLILQENMRWKALAEIYTMHSFPLL